MPTVHLTDRTIRGLDSNGRRVEFFDRSLPGFGVRVTPEGRKTFVLRYRNRESRERRLRLGVYGTVTLADARDRARLLLADVQRGTDPATIVAARKRAATVRELAGEYMERHARPLKRSWRYDAQMVRHDVLPALGDRKAGDVERVDVLRLLDAIVDRGAPYAAVRVRALLSKMYAFGIQRGLVEQNPVRDVPRPIPPRSRERVLTDDELRRLWLALDDESWRVAGSLRLRLLTLQRGNEVTGAGWDEFDGDWWTIPGARTKNKRSHRVPLSPQALAVLDATRAHSGGSGWVFPASRGDGPFAWAGKAARAVRQRLGFDWTPHDLRRSGASCLASIGFSRTVIGKVLNHATIDSGVTAVYDRHSYDAEKRQALVAWGDRVERIVSGRPGDEKVAACIG